MIVDDDPLSTVQRSSSVALAATSRATNANRRSGWAWARWAFGACGQSARRCPRCWQWKDLPWNSLDGPPPLRLGSRGLFALGPPLEHLERRVLGRLRLDAASDEGPHGLHDLGVVLVLGVFEDVVETRREAAEDAPECLVAGVELSARQLLPQHLDLVEEAVGVRFTTAAQGVQLLEDVGNDAFLVRCAEPRVELLEHGLRVPRCRHRDLDRVSMTEAGGQVSECLLYLRSPAFARLSLWCLLRLEALVESVQGSDAHVLESPESVPLAGHVVESHGANRGRLALHCYHVGIGFDDSHTHEG